MKCKHCNTEMNLLGARGGNANGPTTEVWVCIKCSNLLYQTNNQSYNTSGYSITLPSTTTSSGIPYGGVIPNPIYPTFIVDISGNREVVKPEPSPPKNCDLCDELFSSEEEYNEHLKVEHKWIMGKQHEKTDEKEI